MNNPPKATNNPPASREIRKTRKTQETKGIGGIGETNQADVAPPRMIRKYANRRLYDTTSSRHITLTDLALMVRESIEFVVQDAKTGDDMTRNVLTQIILDREGQDGNQLFPLTFLRQVIKYQGDRMQSVLFPGFLDMAVREFADNQGRFEGLMKSSLDSILQPERLAEMQSRNMGFFRDAWSMMTSAPLGPVVPGLAGTSGAGQAGQSMTQGMTQSMTQRTTQRTPQRTTGASPPGDAPNYVAGRTPHYVEGLAEGLAEGQAKGQAEGQAKGQAEGQASESATELRQLREELAELRGMMRKLGTPPNNTPPKPPKSPKLSGPSGPSEPSEPSGLNLNAPQPSETKRPIARTP